MNPEDIFEKGLLRASDLDGGPPAGDAAELGPFGRYVLLEELGRGGAAIVYRALDPLLNRELALKKLRFGAPELETRFLREAGLLARLSHPGIIPVFDFGREGDAHYYTMPLAGGLSLDRWIAERRPEAREAARIVRLAAEALAHAHDQGVLHRDVKPPNILVSGEGVPLLADFGLGRVEDPDASRRFTETGEVMGTPSYMAPELATGDLKGADSRCDVYSLGATLYEALTGRPPFLGMSSLEILKRVTSEEPVAPRRIAPGTPADLEIICLKALEKDPARRYATAREVAEDLGRFLAGEPILARRASPLYRLRRFVGRRRAIVAVALAGLAVAATVLAVGGLKEMAAAARRDRVSNLLHEARRQNENVNRALQFVPETDSQVVDPANLGLEMITKALDEDPDNGEALYLRGVNYALRFDTDEARRNYDAAVQRGYARARLERAILDLQQLVVQGSRNRWSPDAPAQSSALEGIARDVEAMLQDPSLPERKFAEAMVAICGKKWHSASKLLRGYSNATNDWRAYYWLGSAEMEEAQGLPSKSRERVTCLKNSQAALEKALSLRKSCKVTPRILDRLGVALYMAGRNDDSRKRLQESLDLDSKTPDTHYHLANVLLYGFDDNQGAIAAVEIGISLEPDPSNPPAEAHTIRGVAYADRNDLEGLKIAQKCLMSALASYPPDTRHADVLRATLADVETRLKPLEKPPRDY